MGKLHDELKILERAWYKHLIEEYMNWDLSFEEFIEKENLEID